LSGKTIRHFMISRDNKQNSKINKCFAHPNTFILDTCEVTK